MANHKNCLSFFGAAIGCTNSAAHECRGIQISTKSRFVWHAIDSAHAQSPEESESIAQCRSFRLQLPKPLTCRAVANKYPLSSDSRRSPAPKLLERTSRLLKKDCAVGAITATSGFNSDEASAPLSSLLAGRAGKSVRSSSSEKPVATIAGTDPNENKSTDAADVKNPLIIKSVERKPVQA